MRCFLSLLGAVVFVGAGLTAAPAGAAVVNGGFENGDLTGWVPFGDVAVINAEDGILPPGGALMAGLSTESTLGGSAVGGSFVAGFLGVSLGALEAAGFNTGGKPEFGPANFEPLGAVGSAMFQTFSAEAGDEISFAFNFGTNELQNDGANDSAFVILDGEITLLADNGSVFTDFGTEFDLFTGFQTVSLTIDSTGDHTIAFAVLDEGDDIVTSILLVDDVTLSGADGDVPEAPALPLLAMGLLGLWALRGQSARSNRK